MGCVDIMKNHYIVNVLQTLRKRLSAFPLTKPLPYLMIHLVCYCTAPKK